MKWEDHDTGFEYEFRPTTCSHMDQPWQRSWKMKGGDRILIKHLSRLHLWNIISYLKRYYSDRSPTWMVIRIMPWVELNKEAARRGLRPHANR